jgi:hypothetical protein
MTRTKSRRLQIVTLFAADGTIPAGNRRSAS